MNLARDLRLSIDYSLESTGEWLKIRLIDDITLTEAQIDYPLSDNPGSRSYRIREAMVIAMRRLIHQAIVLGMIDLDYRLDSGISIDLDEPFRIQAELR